MKNQRSKPKKAAAKLQLFFFGPGVGESIVVKLPCGRWGVVDCYQSRLVGGTLQFLKEQKVSRLAFFCITHPHEDHFLGANVLLKSYAGKIDEVWRYPDFEDNAINHNILLAAKIQAITRQDAEANSLLDHFVEVLNATRDVTANLSKESYRPVIAPMSLLKRDSYEILALRPTHAILQDLQAQVAKLPTPQGFLLLNDEEGALLNKLSVVLLIKFGNSRILLLGDAQGSDEPLNPTVKRYTVVKVAHHGSINGFAATAITAGKCRVEQMIIGPYSRTGLPTSKMLEKYQAVPKTLILTNGPAPVRPRQIVPSLVNARMATTASPWVGLEVSKSGNVRMIRDSRAKR